MQGFDASYYPAVQKFISNLDPGKKIVHQQTTIPIYFGDVVCKICERLGKDSLETWRFFKKVVMVTLKIFSYFKKPLKI